MNFHYIIKFLIKINLLFKTLMNKKTINPKARTHVQWIINSLTISRILLGLPIIVTLTYKLYDFCILLILLGGLTDYLDGYYARKYNSQSILGAKLDPLADKIMLLGPIIWLAHEDLIPLWAIWLLLSRELLITSWRANIPTGGPASIHGKYKTLLQFGSIILLLWPKNWGTLNNIYILNKLGYILFWISLYLAISSGIKYISNQKEHHQH